MSLVLRVHNAIYRASNGRIGHRVLGVPTLMLTTIGRRSGEPRTNSLVYSRDGHDYLVVASKGGSDSPPAWLLNLVADPHVGIQAGRERLDAVARVIEPSDPDYERVWKLANDNNKDRYTAYQQQTSRPIPVVAITPA
jgi:deazaflavin-dependent oxidoreductase (nitroreductase family)